MSENSHKSLRDSFPLKQEVEKVLAVTISPGSLSCNAPSACVTLATLHQPVKTCPETRERC